MFRYTGRTWWLCGRATRRSGRAAPALARAAADRSARSTRCRQLGHSSPIPPPQATAERPARRPGCASARRPSRRSWHCSAAACACTAPPTGPWPPCGCSTVPPGPPRCCGIPALRPPCGALTSTLGRRRSSRAVFYQLWCARLGQRHERGRGRARASQSRFCDERLEVRRVVADGQERYAVHARGERARDERDG